eukprot:scaffold221296_cov17-Prasinocladus_malaysianus.AAC.1
MDTKRSKAKQSGMKWNNKSAMKYRKVRVTVSQQTLEVTVDDNGHGMSAESMERLGTRYCTSKLLGGQAQFDSGDFTTLGFRGEAFASISDLCLLEKPFVLRTSGRTLVQTCSLSDLMPRVDFRET